VLPALLERLVSIDSVNPSLVPGGAGEAEIAAFIAAWARDAGLEVEVLEATPGRPNVVCRAQGTGGGRTLLLCGHTDTVGGHVELRRDGDRLHGRGAYDMKGGLAAALVTCVRAAELGLAGDVVVAAVADEEYASLGIQEVLRHVRADAAVVTEPTELAVGIGHRGFVWIEVEVTGRAAHGSRPHLGVDAIAHAGPILSGILALDARLSERTDPLLGRGSVHASTIAGGIELSSYPERCVIGLERRTLPGETAGDFEAEVAAILADCAVPASQRTLLVREPFTIDPEHQFVRALPGERAGMSYWADSAFIAAAGIPTVLYGPAGEGAHAADEWVSVSSCETVADALVGVAQRLCA
jgi:acetylornithine deacetylase